MATLEQLIAGVRREDARQFVTRHPGSFLLRRRTEAEIRSLPSAEVGITLGPGQVVGKDPEQVARSLANLAADSQLSEQYEVCPVAKTDRNVFGRGVTVGRAANNDVVVPDKTVSKFHAWIQQQASEHRVYDARSSHGTFVDGAEAPRDGHEGLLLSPGATLRLATVSLTFLDASGLYEWISRELRDREKRG